MNALTRHQYAAILRCLCEGSSVASTSRITGAAKNTVLSLLARAGTACAEYMDERHVDLPCRHIELDEIWSFVGKKAKGTTNGDKLIEDPKTGDVWTWKCVCRDSKLIVGWHVGGRTFTNAVRFCRSVAGRFLQTPQVSTDGLKAYNAAVGFAFGSDVNYGQIVKTYGKNPKGGFDVITGAQKRRVYGNPDMDKVCTSFVERSNLTLRMQNRRFARKTNAHSKIIENHCHMLALGFMHYNYCRKHQTLKMTPAQKAGITGDEWDMLDVVRLIEQREERQQAALFEAAFAHMAA